MFVISVGVVGDVICQTDIDFSAGLQTCLSISVLCDRGVGVMLDYVLAVFLC